MNRLPQRCRSLRGRLKRQRPLNQSLSGSECTQVELALGLVQPFFCLALIEGGSCAVEQLDGLSLLRVEDQDLLAPEDGGLVLPGIVALTCRLQMGLDL